MKVVSSTQMSFIEKLSFEKDPSKEEIFMLQAGKNIAKEVEIYVAEKKSQKNCLLLVGKGNNGGDAFVCGLHLLEKGYHVEAFLLFSLKEGSTLNQKMGKIFFSHKKAVLCKNKSLFSFSGFIIDGLLGTGFKGTIKEPFLSVVKKANASKLPIISIDIPSGVDGNTGIVETEAIHADLTLYLGMAKTGFFLSSGYEHTKHLKYVDFGLEKEYIDQAKEEFILLEHDIVKDFLPPIAFTRHKYQAGYIIALAGSSGMRGAACLSSLAALRMGSGMVRLFVPNQLKMHLPVEAVCSDRLENTFFLEAKRAQAAYFGPGIGRDAETKKFLQALLEKIQLPCVIDADALYLIGKNPETPLPKKAILTPHRKEMCVLLNQETQPEEKAFFSQCQRYCEEKNVYIVLKGAPTFLFQPNSLPTIITTGDPGMATAGAGDVLTGIITSLLSQGLSPFSASALGVYIHGLCGQLAAQEKTSYGVIASDLIEKIPEAIKSITF